MRSRHKPWRAEVGGLALVADIAADDAGPRLVAEAERALGPLDLLVNNAAHATKSTCRAHRAGGLGS